MTLRGPHVPIYWMRFIAPPPAWKKNSSIAAVASFGVIFNISK